VKTVGLRELKNKLSEYIRHVRGGEAVLVTDRGEVVAELSPPGGSAVDTSIPPALAAMARRGMVTLGAAGGGASYAALPRARRKRTAAQLLEEERGGR
jgi:antitoxin (DNA-binding transcriptional repressor) of toxin-antitoxin stability system